MSERVGTAVAKVLSSGSGTASGSVAVKALTRIPPVPFDIGNDSVKVLQTAVPAEPATGTATVKVLIINYIKPYRAYTAKEPQRWNLDTDYRQ